LQDWQPNALDSQSIFAREDLNFHCKGGAQMSFSTSLFQRPGILPTQLSTISRRLIHRRLCHKPEPTFSLPSNSLHLGNPPLSLNPAGRLPLPGGKQDVFRNASECHATMAAHTSHFNVRPKGLLTQLLTRATPYSYRSSNIHHSRRSRVKHA